jgi:hypothetical protein
MLDGWDKCAGLFDGGAANFLRGAWFVFDRRDPAEFPAFQVRVLYRSARA